MAHEFSENEYALEPEASPARGGSPPRKWTNAGVLDPPFPPKRPPGPIPADSASLVFRIFAGLLLAGLAAAILSFLFGRH